MKTILVLFVILGAVSVIAAFTMRLKATDTIDLSFYGNAMFGSPDYTRTGQILKYYNPHTNNGNPEELGSYLEGDMLIPLTKVQLRSGLVAESSRWPDAVVPYEIQGDFKATELTLIQDVINIYQERTCIQFRPHDGEPDYIVITKKTSGCWSAVGRVGGRQDVNLQSPACLSKPGTVMHELMHALGFLHEQNRMERDNYVIINHKNILPGSESNFQKAERSEAFNVSYDYGSIMHYSSTAFSVNGGPTILTLRDPGRTRMGQRIYFSDMDLQKLNRMYKCTHESYGALGGTFSVPQQTQSLYQKIFY